MRLLASFLEIWTGFYLLNIVLPKPKMSMPRKILLFAAVIIGGSILYKSRMEAFVSPITMLIYTAIASLAACIAKKENIIKCTSILWMTYLLTASIQILMSIGLPQMSEQYTYEVLIEVWPFTVILYAGINILIMTLAEGFQKYEKWIRMLLEKNYVSVLCIDFVLFFFIYFWYEIVSSKMPGEIQVVAAFPIFLILLMIIFMVLFAGIISKYRNSEAEKSTILVREEVAKKQYEELSELISQNHQIVHDIKNHLHVLKQFAKMENNENIQKYIDEISKDYAVSMSKYWTGNPVIDFVLNQKIMSAEKEAIQISIKTETIGKIPLSESEICALFGNLLDNAIEAAKDFEDGKRWIEVKITQKRNMFFVEIANNFSKMPKCIDGEFVSAKGQNHGYGLKSVGRIVDKYEGMITYHIEETTFRVNISFLDFEGQNNAFESSSLYEEEDVCDNGRSLSEERQEDGLMKKKIVSSIFYVLNFMLFLFPWIRIGENSYNIFQVAIEQTLSGVEGFVNAAGLQAGDISMVQGGVSMEIFLMFTYLVFSLIYIGSVLIDKKKPFNLIALMLGVVISYIHVKFPGTIGTVATSNLTTAVAMFFTLIPAGEFFTVMVMERWKDTVAESRAYAAEEKAFKEESKRRLAFAGKYDTPFYRVVWKNFKANWKDYILLLFCGVLIIGFVVIGFGIQKIMSLEYSIEGIQMLNGLNSILINAIIPLAIVSVFIIIMLLFYYLKCRAKNYGVFLTLGMRRKALYYFAGLEFLSVFIFSVILGGILGTLVLVLFTHYSELLLGTSVEFSVIGIKTYLKAIVNVLFVFGASALAAREIFVDFNVGKSTDLRAIGEPLPMRWRKSIIAGAFLVCAVCLWQYGLIKNFEKIQFLLGFFVGLFILIRYGLAEYLIRTRRKNKYLKRAVTESQLFHKSKTTSMYVFALAIMQICVLFYFSFQLISSSITEDENTLFPYDLVCIADDEDQDIFEELENEHGIKSFSVPMVRVSAYDTSEKWEGKAEPPSPQGQNIGISESTYHELKKRLDPNYEARDLGLDVEGEYVYIVHQQDKSTKAQPIEFYGTAKRPILMAGQPTVNDIELSRLSRNHNDTAYRYRKIAGEEIGSLVGAFRQGLRENIVVFSDEYFEVAKDLWEITDTYSGLLITGEYFQLRYGGFEVLRKGPTQLVLFEDISEEDMQIAEEYMQKFAERHVDDDAYDASVSSYYFKEDNLKNQETEKFMKKVMNTLVIAIFFIMNIILIAIKMLSELDPNRRRADFLTCMGMYEKDRKKLIMKEILVDHHLFPLIISTIAAFLFTAVVWSARMYTAADIKNYLGYMIPLWGAYVIGSTVVIWILSNIYAGTVEGKKYARRS